ncbi:MAG TPA: sigma 54-interacting transcriptional regulator [Puia sp.]|nr:sigma 54-interacting transcriptional regulator [Puia sp.]
MSQSSTNWLFGKDEQDDLSVFIEGYFHRMKADFIQLLAEPQEEGYYRKCYTFPGTRNFNYDFSLQHKSQVEQLIRGSDVRVYHKTHIDQQLPETSFIRQLSYNRLVYLPIIDNRRPVGLLCVYYTAEAVPDDSLLRSVGHELGLLLMGRAGKNFRIAESAAARISRELAYTRTRKQLSDFFDNSLKNYLGYKQSTIFLLNNNESNLVKNIFSEFHSADPAYLFFDHVRLGKTSVGENFIPLPNQLPAPDVLGFDDFDDGADIFPYLAKQSEKLTNGVIYNLYGGDEIVGKWIVLFGSDNWAFNPGRTVMQQIAIHLTLTIARIHASEKLQKIQEESEIISSLNLDLATTKDKQYLLNIIHQKLRKLFDFGHTVVGLINEDECSFKVFLRDTNSRARNHPLFQTLAPLSVPLVDGVLNKVLLSRDPLVFDLGELRSRGIMPDYMIMWYESEIRKVTICTLQVRSKTIGFWAICHLEGQEMTAKQRELMKNISSQLSIAVDNIRANEMILAKEMETERLLQLSFALTRTRTKDELRDVLRQHMINLISFRELVIRIARPDMESYCLLAISSTDPGFEAESQKYYGNGFPQETLNTDDVLVFDVARLLSRPGAPQFLLDEYDRGIREKVALCLPIEDDHHVSIALHFEKKGACSEHTLQLIKSISYQISFIINNILANERTAHREAERDLLLSLGTRITTVRNCTDLLDVLNTYIRPIVGYTHSLIGAVNHELGIFEPMIPDSSSPWRSDPIYGAIQNRPLPLMDGILDLACVSPDPTFILLASMTGQPNFPVYLRTCYESGILQVIIVRLGNAQKPSGLWLLFMEQPKPWCLSGVNFLNGIAAQIEGSLFNITSNSSIEQREWQKDKLITFNYKTASVREKGPLARVFGEQLSDLLDIAGYVFLQFTDDSKTCFPSLSYMDESFAANSELMLTGCGFSAGSSLFDYIRSSNDRVTIELKDWSTEVSSHKILRFTQDHGRESVSAQVLKIGEKEFGIIFIWHRRNGLTDYQANLWKGVSAQMATAIANLLANERITTQLEEIKTYKARLEEEKIYLKEEIETTHHNLEIIGDSPGIKKVYRLVSQVAPSDSTVLILGETGTGKEVIARAIHNSSPRKGKLMVKVNCAALPANLIESELFGHEKGSFTGATERRIGKFELANNGTLFLDEIGEMPLEMQTKLLRALQEKEIERIGGRTPIKIDVRIIAATNRNLEKEMKEKRFRSDLFYRLNIFPLHLPPLRQRQEDIRTLSLHFIEVFSKKTGKKISNIPARVLNELLQYHWPGNIRELEHTIERSVLLSHGETLKHVDLPATKYIAPDLDGNFDPSVSCTIDENERNHILKILKFCNGKINGRTGAAAILGVPPSTLNSKMKRLNIKKMHTGEAFETE